MRLSSGAASTAATPTGRARTDDRLVLGDGARTGHDLAPEQGEQADGIDPIVVADSGVTCEYCSTVFDPGGVQTTPIPSTTLVRCPACGRWTAEE